MENPWQGHLGELIQAADALNGHNIRSTVSELLRGSLHSWAALTSSKGAAAPAPAGADGRQQLPWAAYERALALLEVCLVHRLEEPVRILCQLLERTPLPSVSAGLQGSGRGGKRGRGAAAAAFSRLMQRVAQGEPSLSRLIHSSLARVMANALAD